MKNASLDSDARWDNNLSDYLFSELGGEEEATQSLSCILFFHVFSDPVRPQNQQMRSVLILTDLTDLTEPKGQTIMAVGEKNNNK